MRWHAFIFAAIAAISFSGFTVAASAWVWSSYHTDLWVINQYGPYESIGLMDKALFFTWTPSVSSWPATTSQVFSFGGLRVERHATVIAFYPVHFFGRMNRRTGMVQDGTEVEIPLYMVASCMLVVPAAWFYVRHKKIRAIDAGQCSACGYDLRASPQRCPECGAAVRAGLS